MRNAHRRHWVALTMAAAFVAGLLWIAATHQPSTSRLDRAMSEAAHQRILTP